MPLLQRLAETNEHSGVMLGTKLEPLRDEIFGDVRSPLLICSVPWASSCSSPASMWQIFNWRAHPRDRKRLPFERHSVQVADALRGN